MKSKTLILNIYSTFIWLSVNHNFRLFKKKKLKTHEKYLKWHFSWCRLMCLAYKRNPKSKTLPFSIFLHRRFPWPLSACVSFIFRTSYSNGCSMFQAFIHRFTELNWMYLCMVNWPLTYIVWLFIFLILSSSKHAHSWKNIAANITRRSERRWNEFHISVLRNSIDNRCKRLAI